MRALIVFTALRSAVSAARDVTRSRNFRAWLNERDIDRRRFPLDGSNGQREPRSETPFDTRLRDELI